MTKDEYKVAMPIDAPLGRFEVRIIQLMTWNDSNDEQDYLLGLANTGDTYEVDRYGKWSPFIPNVEMKKNE